VLVAWFEMFWDSEPGAGGKRGSRIFGRSHHLRAGVAGMKAHTRSRGNAELFLIERMSGLLID